MIQTDARGAPSVELLISMGALLVAAWSVVVAKRTSNRALKLQERLLALEHARDRDRKVGLQQAAVRADIIPSGQHTYSLRIVNDGPGQARSLNVLVDGVPVAESEHFTERDSPVTTLGPGAQVKYRFLSHMGMKRLYAVRLEWADDSSPERSWYSDLKV